ncbi:RAMP superfamily CRISPR-associated protein [Ferrovum sp.]|uniref:RAMP superfamily CRISPR-associated protein n=1 Tax=Ferrovum sp. TaxID=2609467 RepID=UPI00260536D4|nr:RAMP superfamily CRISPR-associated protein [Ferrovum sp.]
MTHVLQICVRSYWHSGTGRGLGAAVDAAAYRDADNLPALPGRHIKGLLRHALEQARFWGWKGHADGILVRSLFGQRTEQVSSGQIPSPGMLRVSDARLPAELCAWLTVDKHGAQRAALFRVLQSTAVDEATGSARDWSLRGIEVVVPLDLQASVEPISGTGLPSDWPERLREVLPLIPAVGGHRTRGLGRAQLTLEAA